jgi:CHAT domain-containing protein/tetratricopeptide (TPR) repeat protein
MSHTQDLISAFFNALQLRKLDQCQAHLESLESLSHSEPTLQAWCAYLRGILVFETHHDWAEAERIFGKLLQVELEPDMRRRVLFALGRSLEAQGRWEEAIAAFEQTLPLCVELEQNLEKVKAWKEIAICYRRGFTRGDFGPPALQQALAHCQLALDTLAPITDPAPGVAWLQGSVWNTLGLVHRSLGQWDQAIDCYKSDLEICRSLDDRLGIGLCYGNLGEVYQKRGRENWPQALQAYQQALDLIREFDEPHQEIEVLANLGFLHQEMGQYEAAFEFYSQAIDLIEALRVGVSSEEARAGFFATVVGAFANTVLLCLELERPEQAFDYVERARSRAFLDVLTAGSPRLSQEIATTPMNLTQVQAALPSDALLLEYFVTGLVEAREDRAAPRRHRLPPARTLIFAVTRQEVQVHDAGVSPNDLLPRQLESIVERHFLKPQIRRALYQRLIAPVERLLQGRRWLYLMPHGPLHYIPFQALVAADGETLLRQGGPALVYAPSATVLLRDEPRKPSPATASCLAVGYNSRGKQRLRLAEAEAHSVARQTAGRVLAGPSPKKAILYAEAANYRLLHFSCHGEFDPQSPLASALHLAPGEALTALDILDHLRLRCELVTLSACESGLSRVRRGDELVGLIRAFMYAGATALLSTLWRVDERSTLILMEKFYQKILAGLDPAEALQQAQLYLKNLGRQEARDVLARFAVDEILSTVAPADERRSEISASPAVLQAGVYLKGKAADRQQDSAGARDDDKIFADPYYWAPFILVGNRGPGSVKK